MIEMLYERAEKLCTELVNIRKRGIAVVFDGPNAIVKENVLSYDIPDKWTAVLNTFLKINYISNGNTLSGEDDPSYLRDQEELVDALYKVAELADKEGLNDRQFLEICTQMLSDSYDEEEQ